MRQTVLSALKRARRTIYKLRIFIPGLRSRHQLEAMVGPLGFWNELRRYQVRVLQRMGLRPHHALLDIGCGPLQGGAGFIGYLLPGNYAGVDIKKKAISLAHRIVCDSGRADKNPLLLVSDSFGERELSGRRFDYIWASQMLYYLNALELQRLLSAVSSLLKPDGLFLGDIIGPEHYEFTRRRHGWFLHSLESISAASLRYDLYTTELGKIADFGYPRCLSLCTNRLISLQHVPYFPYQERIVRQAVQRHLVNIGRISDPRRELHPQQPLQRTMRPISATTPSPS